MGEQRRRIMAEGNEPKIIATCPVCKKDFIADGKSKLLVTSYLIPMGQSMGQMKMATSLPKIACTGCGVEFFAAEALEELRKKAAGETAKIIMARPNVVKMN
jgi:hypothetical protein